MHEYIVHVVRKNLRDWAMDVTIPGQRGRVYTYWNSDYASVKGALDSENPEQMETWYCNDEGSAKALAMHLSVHSPGAHVGVYKVTHVARTPTAAPILSTFSEQGLIPE